MNHYISEVVSHERRQDWLREAERDDQANALKSRRSRRRLALWAHLGDIFIAVGHRLKASPNAG